MAASPQTRERAQARAPSAPRAHRARSEFGGPLGHLALMLALPAAAAYLYFCARFNQGALLPQRGADLASFAASLAPSWPSAAAFLGWLAFQALLQCFAPGPHAEGMPLEDGRRLRYRMNGRASLLISALAFGAGVATGLFPARWIYDHFGELLSLSVAFCYAFALFLLLYGRAIEPHDRAPHDPAPHGREPRGAIADYFLGAARNPRLPPVTGFDFKVFFEARPGLIGWLLVLWSFAAVQLERDGSLSLAMALVCALQLAYVLDYFWHEPAILSTLDVQHEKFGWMLLFGDLVWVPFTYTLQAHYLVEHSPALSIPAAALCAALGLTGLTLFRVANLQKHRFRSGSAGLRFRGRPAEYIQTSHGNRLLVSGLWGWSRHANYLGDWLLGLSWSLACGFGSLLPYYYPIYFALLLAHRERRDHRRCEIKYGEDWQRYCRRVRWRIVPGLY